MESSLPDNQQRKQALDPTRSFIVQAPAGSGKTGVLVKRFLVLLARVDAPEEIIAITFTRKAAAEMRERIVKALNGGYGTHDPDMASLAASVLQNDLRHQWRLAENPGRLRIQTIDAFAYELVRHMPWSARFGAAPSLVDDLAAQHLYQEAAKRALDHIDLRDEWSSHCANLLKLCDARFDKAETLLADMLRKRDQWMRGLPIHSAGNFSRGDCQAMWQQVIVHQLAVAHRAIPRELQSEITLLAQFAAAHPDHENPNAYIAACSAMQRFPDARPDLLAQWRGIAALLLTKTRGGYALRKPGGINKRLGFPLAYKSEKARMQSMLKTLGEYPKIIQTLSTIANLPDANFSEQQWQNLESLLLVLPLAAAELRVLFKEANQADYVEITQRAIMALGDVDSPSELALSADHKIKHILMDEVQDTSSAQIALLKKLTREWQPAAGRTFFFVGDPMQSIYRFREAEVGNFLDIKKKGIGNIKPESLALETNFRSNKKLVTWFNRVFPGIFPASDDVIASAVRYSPSTSNPNTSNDEPAEAEVSLHPYIYTDARSEAEEAEFVANQIGQALNENSDVKIGVLGRSRAHLIGIAQTLRRRRIDYQAVELESLAQRPPIQDLMSLTRALLQLSDRIAWMAILRAPWCGLDLKDLSRLTMHDHSHTALELAEDDSVVRELSASGRERLEKFLFALAIPISQRGRVSLRQNVMAAWFNLSGPACVDESDNEDCEIYFELLDTLEKRALEAGGQLITPEVLHQAAARHWSQTSSTARVQLLTIHKAKGLEFDVVIVPKLNSRSRTDNRDLLRWTRLPEQLLIAVLPHGEDRDDKFYPYLGILEKQRQRNELCRLLYVACTRARQQLHLFINITLNSKDEPRNPETGSFWGLLWPVLATEIAPETEGKQAESCRFKGKQKGASPLTEFRRLPLDWKSAAFPAGLKPAVPLGKSAGIDKDEIEFSWAGEMARITGIAIHHMLQYIGATNWQEWKQQDNHILMARAEYFLRYHGLNPESLQYGLTSMGRAIENLQSDARADWIFSHRHTGIKAEWPLTGVIDNAFTSIIIDRSFIDDCGTRWIIDFKSSRHEDSDTEHFLDQEQQRYQQQMERYARVVALLEEHDIKLGLYFPMLKGWREWRPG